MNEIPLGEKSMLAMLLEKLAMVKEIEAQTGASSKAAEEEVWRQIKQINGDLVKGQAITKSGRED